MTSVTNATRVGRSGTVSTAMPFAVRALMHQPASFSPAPATAVELRSTMLVRTATSGRLSRMQPTSSTAPGSSTSIRGASPLRNMIAVATSGGLFAPFTGSPNSKRSERIKFFKSLIRSMCTCNTPPPAKKQGERRYRFEPVNMCEMSLLTESIISGNRKTMHARCGKAASALLQGRGRSCHNGFCN